MKSINMEMENLSEEKKNKEEEKLYEIKALKAIEKGVRWSQRSVEQGVGLGLVDNIEVLNDLLGKLCQRQRQVLGKLIISWLEKL